MRCRTTAEPIKPAPPVTMILIRRPQAWISSVDLVLFGFAREQHERMTVIGKGTIKFRQTRKPAVLFGNDEIGRSHRPGNRNVRVIPPYSAVERAHSSRRPCTSPGRRR